MHPLYLLDAGRQALTLLPIMSLVRTRFAPSPTGYLHIGGARTALFNWLFARKMGGTFILRIEDTDNARNTEEATRAIFTGMEWLGLDWDEGYQKGGAHGPYLQSERTARYAAAFRALEERGLVYPCYCTRAERLAASAPHRSDGVPVYDGRCRRLPPEELARLARSRRPAWRVRVPEEVLSFRDLLQGGVSQDLSLDCGDFILRRSDGVYAYQLAVVVDDGAMGVTQVVRGSDLLDSTPRQLWLQERLGLPHPEYGHVPLLLAPDGRRLAKRDRDQELGALQSCYSAQELVGQLALLAGLIPEYAPISPAELIPLFSWEKLPQADCAVHWADGICTFFTKTIQSPVQRDRPPV